MSLIEKHFGNPTAFLCTAVKSNHVESDDISREAKRLGEQSMSDTVSEIYKSKHEISLDLATITPNLTVEPITGVSKVNIDIDGNVTLTKV